MTNKLKIEYVLITEIRPNEYNPKQMTEKEAKDLEKSIVDFGIVDPLIVNSAEKRKGIIIGGHQRYNIYQKLKYKEVPVVWVDIPNLEREQELCLRLSKNTGGWDFDLLANFEEELLIDTGFEKGELDEIFGIEEDEEFDTNKTVENPKGIKEGDIWLLGEHKLIIGDCTKKENWESLLGEERFDFMFTDPPYQIGANIGDKKKGHHDYKMKVKKKDGFGYKGMRKYKGLAERGGVPDYDEWLSIAQEFQNEKGVNVMIFESWKNAVKLWQAIEKYWKVRNQIIWWLPNRCQGFGHKHRFYNKYDIAPLAGERELNEGYEQEFADYLEKKGQRLLDSYEVILYAKEGKSYWDKKKGTKWARINDHITHSAETSKSGGQNIIFGTKPIQILVPFIKILSPRDGIVMEPFGGSGSTIIACEIMKRRCRAIEVETTYAEVIVARWEKFTGKQAKKIKGQ